MTLNVLYVFAGWLYDISQSYEIPFIFSGSVQIISGLAMSYVPYTTYRNERIARRECNEDNHNDPDVL